jgi:hypothetical protein
VRNGDLRLLSAGITRNIHLEAGHGALREFVKQLQSRVGELQELAAPEVPAQYHARADAQHIQFNVPEEFDAGASCSTYAGSSCGRP